MFLQYSFCYIIKIGSIKATTRSTACQTITIATRTFLSVDESEKRAYQLALMVTALIQASKEPKYLNLLSKLVRIRHEARSTKAESSPLFQGLALIVAEAQTVLHSNFATYEQELSAFQSARNSADLEMVSRPSQKHIFLANTGNTPSDVIMKRGDNKYLSLKKDNKDISPQEDKEKPSLPHQVGLLEGKSQSSGKITNGFFQMSSSRMECYKPETDALGFATRQLLDEYGWFVDSKSKAAMSFFEAISIHINQLPNKKHSGLIQAEDLRKACSHIPNSGRPSISLTVYDGQLSEYGVFLCKQYRHEGLEAIYEIEIQSDGSLKFSAATPQGYEVLSKVTDDIYMEIKARLSEFSGVVLLKEPGGYYCVHDNAKDLDFTI